MASPGVDDVDGVVEKVDKFLAVGLIVADRPDTSGDAALRFFSTIEIGKKVVYKVRFAVFLSTLNLFFHVLFPFFLLWNLALSSELLKGRALLIVVYFYLGHKIGVFCERILRIRKCRVQEKLLILGV